VNEIVFHLGFGLFAYKRGHASVIAYKNGNQ